MCDCLQVAEPLLHQVLRFSPAQLPLPELFGLELLEFDSRQDLDKVDLKHLDSLAGHPELVWRGLFVLVWGQSEWAARCPAFISNSACEEQVLHCAPHGSPAGGLLD